MLSIVVPIYNEAQTLPELRLRLEAFASDCGFGAVEVLLIDDGSLDRSRELIREMASGGSIFRGVLLARNFGHQAAISMGLQEARGSVVAIIDGDLQDPPEAIGPLVQALEDQEADVAYGVRQSRKEGPLKRIAYYCFYRLLARMADIPIPLDSGDFCCMRRTVVTRLLDMPERRRFVRGLRAWVGFRQVAVPYERSPRFASQSKYSVPMLIGLAYDGFFSFSGVPVRLIQFMGLVISTLAFFVAIGYLLAYFITDSSWPPGFATLVISIWFLGGVQLLGLGLVGEYVYRTCVESRGRPVAVIQEIVGSVPLNESSEPVVVYTQRQVGAAIEGRGR